MLSPSPGSLREPAAPAEAVERGPWHGGRRGHDHALVVRDRRPAAVTVRDPQHGARRCTPDALQEAWAALQCRTVVMAVDQ
jgi:hypothetical protein